MHARQSTFQAVRDGVALALFVAFVGTAVVFLAVTSAHAATVARTVTPAQQACQAFAVWEQHETAANLGRLVTAAAKLPKSYLKADEFQLAADASSPSAKAVKYVRIDRKYVAEDCSKL